MIPERNRMSVLQFIMVTKRKTSFKLMELGVFGKKTIPFHVE